MAPKRKGILSAEETERVSEIIGALRRIQKTADHLLEALEEMTAQCAEIGREHGVSGYSGDACNAG